METIELDTPTEKDVPSVPSTTSIRQGEGDADAANTVYLGDADAANIPSTPEKERLAVDKIFARDRVAKFDDEGQLLLGNVAINLRTFDTKIEWDDGCDEMLQRKPNGICLPTKIAIFDRKAVGFGSKVSNANETRIGTVREKRFLVTLCLALEDHLDCVLRDISCEDLEPTGISNKGDKVVYNQEWIGLVADTRARIHFKMDKDGKIGNVADDTYGSRFPRPGEKIKSMLLRHLWEAQWESGNSWWNFLKSIGDPATIFKTEIDYISIAWMGHVDKGIPNDDTELPECPSNLLRSEEEIRSVEYMYGRNWKYIREYETWTYNLKESDTLVTYDNWVRSLNDEMFFGLVDKSIDIGFGVEKNRKPKLELEPGTMIYVKIIMWRSVVDIEWDDGSIETLPSFEVKPYQFLPSKNDSQGIITGDDFCAGDIIKDTKELEPPSKYGYIHNVLQDKAVVKWVTPNPAGGLPHVSLLTEVPFSDIDWLPEYLYLRCLHQLPVVVPKEGDKGLGIVVDGVRVGIVVGINIAEAKIVVKCPAEEERLVWAHDFVHFEGDVYEDISRNKWVNWHDHGHVHNPGKSDSNSKAKQVLCRLPSISIELDNLEPEVKVEEITDGLENLDMENATTGC